jgi:serine/threonine protein phosphatase PrpC
MSSNKFNDTVVGNWGKIQAAGAVKCGLNHICQDAIYLSTNQPAFVIADGVTNPSEKEVFYLVHSVCEKIIQLLDQYPYLPMKNLFVEANKFIHNINLREQCVECLGLVLSAVLFDEDHQTLNISWIGDCGVQVLDSYGAVKFQTNDQVIAAQHYLDSLHFSQPESRRNYVRNHIRNNPDACDADGKIIGFGVLDGDPRACNFISSVSIPVDAGWKCIGYSDGFSRLLYETELFEILHSNSIGFSNIESLPVKIKKNDDSIFAGESF